MNFRHLITHAFPCRAEQEIGGNTTTITRTFLLHIFTYHWARLRKSLAAVEKCSYLKGYLTGPAEKCIEKLPLTNENYEEALTLLRERFGNPQLIIA